VESKNQNAELKKIEVRSEKQILAYNLKITDYNFKITGYNF